MFSLSKYINTVRLKNPIKGQIIIMSTFFLKKWFCTFIFGGSIGHVQSIHYQITPSNIKPSIWPLKQLFSSLLEDLFNMKVSYLDWRWLKSRCCYTDTTCHPVPWLQEKKNDQQTHNGSGHARKATEWRGNWFPNYFVNTITNCSFICISTFPQVLVPTFSNSASPQFLQNMHKSSARFVTNICDLD